VHCLYCGKDIGALRLLKDREFCSAAHRKSYKERLGRVLTQIGSESESPPPPSAGFLFNFTPFVGNTACALHLWQFGGSSYPVHPPAAWPVAVPEFAHRRPKSLAYAGSTLADGEPRPYIAWRRDTAIREFDLHLVTESPIEQIPERCQTLFASPGPQVVERWLDRSLAGYVRVNRNIGRPALTLAIDTTFTPPDRCESFVSSPSAEPVAALVASSSAAVGHAFSLPALPPFALHIDTAFAPPDLCETFVPVPAAETVAAFVQAIRFPTLSGGAGIQPAGATAARTPRRYRLRSP